MSSILLIDDDAALLEVLCLAFQDAGHRVQTAPDGAAGLRLVEASDVELVVSDVNMPHVDGFALCRKLREEAEREMLYASILALHRDVREILRIVAEGPTRAGAAVSPFEGLREVHAEGAAPPPPSLSLEQIERTAIREALNRSAGNRRRAADFLGISERTLYRKIKEYGLA